MPACDTRGIAPESSAVPFQKQRFLFRQATPSVIHKKHKLYAKGDNSHFMRRMLNSHWNPEFKELELEKRSDKTSWALQTSTPCPEGLHPLLPPVPWRDPHPEGDGAARPGEEELLGRG